MDDLQFDRFARAVAGLTSRRGLLGIAASLPVAGGALVLLDPGDSEAKKRKKKKRKKKKKKKCTPEAKTTTCNGKCGPQVNNCKQTVDCGSCACNPPCGECFQCNTATATCVPADAGTACGAGPSCDSGLEIFQDTCDGNGFCQPGGGEFCRPYICAGNVCGTTCANDNDCEFGAYCDGGVCREKNPNGAPCNGPIGCLSNACCNNICQECCNGDGSTCPAEAPVCFQNLCAQCGSNPAGCPTDTCCNSTTGACVANCPQDEICDTNNTCGVPCSGDSCGIGKLCDAGICRDCTVSPFQNLQTEITNANPGATLYVCAGSYPGVGGQFDIDKSLTIVGAGDGVGGTTMDGLVAISGSGSDVTLRGVLIDGTAFGVRFQGQNLLMERCTVTGSGIGVDNTGGTLEMRGCSVINNSTNADGGGVRNLNGSVILRNCLVQGNTAARGAGIWTASSPPSTPSSLQLFNTKVKGNTATGVTPPFGAGILNFNSTSEVAISTDSVVCENTPVADQCSGFPQTRCFDSCS